MNVMRAGIQGALDRGFPLRVPGQSLSAGSGACDPAFDRAFFALAPARLATVFFALTAGGGGDLAAASGVTAALCTRGQGEPGADLGAAGATLQYSETDLSTNGSFVDSGKKFTCVGIGVSIDTPFTPGVPDPLALQTVPVWVEEYTARIKALFLRNLQVQLTLGKSEPRTYQIGPAGLLYPDPAASHGPCDSDFNVGTPQSNNVTPWRVGLTSGGDKDGDKLEGLVTLARSINVGVSTTPAVGTLLVPVRFRFYGFPWCPAPGEGDGGVCCNAGGGADLSQLKSENMQLRASLEAMKRAALGQ